MTWAGDDEAQGARGTSCGQLAKVHLVRGLPRGGSLLYQNGNIIRSKAKDEGSNPHILKDALALGIQTLPSRTFWKVLAQALLPPTTIQISCCPSV